MSLPIERHYTPQVAVDSLNCLSVQFVFCYYLQFFNRGLPFLNTLKLYTIKYLLPLFSVCLATAFNGFSQDKITIEPRPATILIEQGAHKQIINFDFLVANVSADTLSLDKLSVSVFDKDNNLLQTRFLDNNGTAPGIFMLPKRNWPGRSTHLLFNPFAEFELNSPISRMEFEWTFSNNARQSFTVRSVVHPKKYQQQNKLSFPLKGRMLVYDAHDLSSHHRRFDYNFEMIHDLGLHANFMRYAYDFILLDNRNKQFRTTGETDQDFFGFGTPVYAVANGKVIYVATGHKDDKNFDVPKLKENPLELYGNCIAIEHAGGSISIYGHLKENSIKVKLGDVIKASQPIAQVGVSGSSFLPHLHFEMRTSLSGKAEGLPSYFDNIFLLDGKLKTKLVTGSAETGNIIEAK
jgi:hypothetical protein